MQRAGRRGELVLLGHRHLLRRLRKLLGTRAALMRACVLGILLDRSWGCLRGRSVRPRQESTDSISEQIHRAQRRSGESRVVPVGKARMRQERRVDASTVWDPDCYIAMSDCCHSIETHLSLTCVRQHVGGSESPVGACVVCRNHALANKSNHKGSR